MLILSACSCLTRSVTLFTVLLAALFLNVTYSESARYDGHHLVRVLNPNAIPSAVLQRLDKWGSRSDSGAIDLHATPEQLAELQRAAGSGLQYSMLVHNVQDAIDTEHRGILRYTASRNEMARQGHLNGMSAATGLHESYHTFDELRQFYTGLAGERRGRIEYTPSIGKTVEGRDIPVVRITGSSSGSSGSKGSQSERPVMFLQCLLHAREWISGAVCAYLADRLSRSTLGTDAASVMNSVDVVIVPVANPDGYAYTWSSDRLWRKNRRVNGDGSTGVDLNRNFPYHFQPADGSQRGASGDPSHETYRGPEPMSEPETQAIVRYYRSLAAVVGAIDFHSYSEYVLRPYGDSTQQAPDEAQFAAAGDAVVAAIERAGGPRYQSLNAMSGLYPTTGIAGDFFYGRDPTAPKGSGPMRGGHYAYGLSIELSPAHDGGTAGFVLDPSHIEPVGKQMLAALSAFTSHVIQNPL